jgi:hypothetical protein
VIKQKGKGQLQKSSVGKTGQESRNKTMSIRGACNMDLCFPYQVETLQGSSSTGNAENVMECGNEISTGHGSLEFVSCHGDGGVVSKLGIEAMKIYKITQNENSPKGEAGYQPW